MGEPVLADAQFGIIHVMRPFSGFESVYEGKQSIIPIMFSEQGEPLDPLANDPGYSPKLVKGLSVPFGARVTIWLPSIFAATQGQFVQPYNWFVDWRLRNVFDFRQRRIPFHFGKQGAGVPDSSSIPIQPRVVIPAAQQSVVYNQTENGLGSFVSQNVDTETLSTVSGTLGLPLLPDGTQGVIQQGLLDPGSPNPEISTRASPPLYLPFEYQVLGDEMLIGVFREFGDPPHPFWNFTTIGTDPDALFSVLFGNGGQGGPFRDIGVYVTMGSAP